MSKRIMLLQALASAPQDLKRLLHGVNAEVAQCQPSSEECSLNNVMLYLIEYEQEGRAQLQRILEEERPLLSELPGVPTRSETSQSLPDLLARFEQSRQDTVSFLQEVHPGGWQRRAQYSDSRETTFRTLVQAIVSHDTEYLNHVIDIQQKVRALPRRSPQPAIGSMGN